LEAKILRPQNSPAQRRIKAVAIYGLEVGKTRVGFEDEVVVEV